MKTNVFFSIVVVALLLAACQPAVPETVIVTQLVYITPMATDTQIPSPSPRPTDTPEPTLTPTEFPTETQVPTPTPDVRVLIVEPEKAYLKSDELPPEGKYYLPGSDWISPHHNEEIISGWGREDGLAYLEESGRVDGWWVEYARGTEAVRVPEYVYQNIIMYKTKEGALLTRDKYNLVADPSRSDLVWYLLDVIDPSLKDICVAMENDLMQPNGTYWVDIRYECVYRNWLNIIQLSDNREGYVTQEFAEQVQKLALAKLEAMPLSNP